jgi:hypothetical protein
MGRPAGLEAWASRRDQRSFPMNASARTEMEAEAGVFTSLLMKLALQPTAASWFVPESRWQPIQQPFRLPSQF